MADAPAPITSPPGRDFQPWDATSESAKGGWATVPEGGSAGWDGRVSEPFPDGPGPWRQT